MKAQIFYILSLLLFYLEIIAALNLKTTSLKMMKELKSIDFLFLELMDPDGAFGNNGLRFLSKLLESETFPFLKLYIKHCKSFGESTFIYIKDQSNYDQRLDISRILAPDCISSSKLKFSKYEEQLIPFFESNNIEPLLSNRFKPSKWTIGAFRAFVRQATFRENKPDWTGWCKDIGLKAEHFNSDFWVSNDNLWKLLNYKCFARINERNRIFPKSKFLEIFKPKFGDSIKQTVMKIITLGATFIAYKETDTNSPCQKTDQLFKDNAKSLLNHILSVFKVTNDKTVYSIVCVAAKILKNCGLNLNMQNSNAWPCSKKVLKIVYDFLKDFPLVNSSWLLNLIYLSIKRREYFKIDNSIDNIIDLFFELVPSIPSICQLLEIIGLKKSKLRISIISKLSSKGELISKVYQECPRSCNTLLVPLKDRVKTVLMSKRTFSKEILKLVIPSKDKDQFWALLDIILQNEPEIFHYNKVKFERGSKVSFLQNLDEFFKFFLESFLQNPILYIQTGIENDFRPIIVPSLLIPARVAQILFKVLTRSIILDFKVPFIVNSEFFDAAYNGRDHGRFAKLIRIKRMFYGNPRILDNYDALACDRINQNDDDIELITTHIKNVCKRESTTMKAPHKLCLRLLESQFHAVYNGIFSIFPSYVTFKAEEIFSLIFMR